MTFKEFWEIIRADRAKIIRALVLVWSFIFCVTLAVVSIIQLISALSKL